MENFKLTKTTTLISPDYDYEIEIVTMGKHMRLSPDYVSFESLEKWVISVREQIKHNAVDKEPCDYCDHYKTFND